MHLLLLLKRGILTSCLVDSFARKVKALSACPICDLLRGQQSVYVREDVAEHTISACGCYFADPVVGLIAFETGLAWHRNCVPP